MRRLSLGIAVFVIACLAVPVAGASAAHLYWTEGNADLQRVDELGQNKKVITTGATLVALDDAHVYSALYDNGQGTWIIRRNGLEGEDPVPVGLDEVGLVDPRLLHVGGGRGFRRSRG